MKWTTSGYVSGAAIAMTATNPAYAGYTCTPPLPSGWSITQSTNDLLFANSNSPNINFPLCVGGVMPFANATVYTGYVANPLTLWSASPCWQPVYLMLNGSIYFNANSVSGSTTAMLKTGAVYGGTGGWYAKGNGGTAANNLSTFDTNGTFTFVKLYLHFPTV